MNDDAVILGSENPSADVLVYDKTRKYDVGQLVLNDNGTIEDEFLYENSENKNAIYEYVSEA